MRQVRIQSDGNGRDTKITLDDGTELRPIAAMIWMEGVEMNRVEITFLGPSLDVHAELAETAMTCPVCGHEQKHYCPEGKSL